jgi:hypothetical protein
MIPDHINPIAWHQALGVARQSCARFFRDGASAQDAMRAFGADPSGAERMDWGKAIEAIALVLCAQPQRRAA